MNNALYTTTLIILHVIFSTFFLKALYRTSLNKLLIIIATIILSMWLGALYFLISNGFFTASGMSRLSFVVGVVLPVILGFAVVLRFKVLREAVNTMTTSDFLQLQFWRAIYGVMFFFTFDLPMWFKYVGGLGDIIAGLGAFFTCYLFSKGKLSEKQTIIRGNSLGILDFMIVLTLGVGVVLENGSPDVIFSLIPLYVVPIFILLHIFSLKRLEQIKN